MPSSAAILGLLVSQPMLGADFEIFFGPDVPTRSSRYLLGNGAPPETQPTFNVGVAVAITFPRWWFAVEGFAEIGIHTLDTAAVLDPPAAFGERVALLLGLRLQPPGEGLVPFARLLFGTVRLSGSNEILAEDGTLAEPGSFVEYYGALVGVTAGGAYNWRSDSMQGAVSFGLRYAVTRWNSFVFATPEGAPVEEVETLAGIVRPGRGHELLHQLFFLVGVRFSTGFARSPPKTAP